MASFTLARTDVDGNIMTYTSDNMVSMNIDNNTPVPPMPLPIQKSDKTLLIKVEGNITTVTVNWKIRDLPSNVSQKPFTGDESAGYTGNVANLVGALQVIDFWKNWFVPVTPDESYTLILGGSMTFKGNMISSSFTVNQANPAVWEGNFRFVEGNVAGATHADLAELTHGALTDQGSQVVRISQIATTYLGVNTGITGYTVKYREKGTTSWTAPTVSYGSGSTSQTAQNISFSVGSAGTYEVKVSPKVSSGIIQQESALTEIVVS